MRRPDIHRRLSASQRAGIVAASASVPTSLVPSLRPRSAVDQGVITGLSSAMNYALTALAHDMVLGGSHTVLRLARARADLRNTARTTLAVDVVAFAVASAVHAALPQRADESIARALVRTGAHRIRAAHSMPCLGGTPGWALRSAPSPGWWGSAPAFRRPGGAGHADAAWPPKRRCRSPPSRGRSGPQRPTGCPAQAGHRARRTTVHRC